MRARSGEAMAKTTKVRKRAAKKGAARPSGKTSRAVKARPPKRSAAPSRSGKETGRKRAAGGSVREVLAWLERAGTKATRDGMARYAIPSDKAYGVPVGVLRAYAK